VITAYGSATLAVGTPFFARDYYLQGEPTAFKARLKNCNW
jgi:hypothetical protein